MITDNEIKSKGLKILTKHLGDVEAERFIALIQREPFDYTKWRKGLDEDLSIEEISKKSKVLKKKSLKPTYVDRNALLVREEKPFDLQVERKVSFRPPTYENKNALKKSLKPTYVDRNALLGSFFFVVLPMLLLVAGAGITDSGGGKSSEPTRKEQIEVHFSGWDSSHKGLTKLVKESMNDPNSYEHVKTIYWDKGDHLIVKTSFRCVLSANLRAPVKLFRYHIPQNYPGG